MPVNVEHAGSTGRRSSTALEEERGRADRDAGWLTTALGRSGLSANSNLSLRFESASLAVLGTEFDTGWC